MDCSKVCQEGGIKGPGVNQKARLTYYSDRNGYITSSFVGKLTSHRIQLRINPESCDFLGGQVALAIYADRDISMHQFV